MHFVRLLAVCWLGAQSAWDNHVLACNIFPDFKNFFTDRLSNKLVLICLLTPPPHLKYVTTLPSNLSLIASFLALMFHKECKVWWDINNQCTANLLESLPEKEFWKSVKIWQNYGHGFGVQFFGPPCTLHALVMQSLSTINYLYF